MNVGGGGGRQPMVIEDFYESRDVRIYDDYSPSLRADRQGLKTVEEVPISTNMTEISGTIRATYYKNGERNIAENIMNKKGYEGVIEPCIVASRGRDPENPSNRTTGVKTEQRLEIKNDGTTNCLTSAAKDNWVLDPINTEDDGTSRTIKAQYYKTSGANYMRTGDMGATGVCGTNGRRYRIRKLTPKECWRLQGFSDEDFEKAAEVNSNTSLYKQAGNSIAKNCLVAIFGQMFDGKEDTYKNASTC